MIKTYGEITPRDYQLEAHQATAKHIRTSRDPVIVNATVGAGKSLLIAMVCHRVAEMGHRALVITRQGEIAEQDSEEMWNAGVKNSLFSASLGKKSTYYPIVVGTEGTVCRALDNQLADFAPLFLFIDECHMCDTDDVLLDEPQTQYGKIIKTLLAREPRMRIIGYTGSPYRGIDPIIGNFWKEQIYNIDTETLVNRGFLVPTIFGYGHDDVQYDLTEFAPMYEQGTQDFTAEQLRAMQKKILSDGTMTQKIMLEVMELTKDRNGVLITCSGKKHCLEAAKYLPEGSYAVITDDLSTKRRRELLKHVRDGVIKYVLQIGCLTTGFNAPIIDTSVLLRKIGSLTLLTQLLGRGMRTLKQYQIDAGIVKTDHLVLDYAGTMHEMGQLYHDPILERAERDYGKKRNETKVCHCGEENSFYARRCIACGHWWTFRECEDIKNPAGVVLHQGCGAKNDVAARQCRECGNTLIDPNEKLLNKHYTEGDFIPVESFNIKPTKNQEGLLFEYGIRLDGKLYTAREVFFPWGDSVAGKNAFKMKAVMPHVEDKSMLSKIMKSGNARNFMQYAPLFRSPSKITHRINGKKRDVIAKKVFD
ncbi:putative ATP-dependent helicase [Plesiomonas phage phiP4-7]|nr:putative ATP-dependent helicase [Plesiomonas phage phiP4-7]